MYPLAKTFYHTFSLFTHTTTEPKAPNALTHYIYVCTSTRFFSLQENVGNLLPCAICHLFCPTLPPKSGINKANEKNN